jgi:hypothetical protein
VDKSLAPTPMLTRLELEIASIADPVVADSKKLERASYISRLGRIDEAASIINSVKKKYESRPDGRISCWVHLANGLNQYFADMNPGARESLLRSHALSAAVKLPYETSLAAAWLAHLEYARSDYISMSKYIDIAFDISFSEYDSSTTRAALVVAQAYHFLGDVDSALMWYRFVRIVATNNGDGATISAMMHNMAWLKFQVSRAQSCGLPIEGMEVGNQILMAAQSAESYDEIIGSVSLPSLLPMLTAQILLANHDFEGALKIYCVEDALCEKEARGNIKAELMADFGWCLFNMNKLDEAREKILYVEDILNKGRNGGNSLYAHARAAQVYAGLGNDGLANEHKRIALEGWVAHLETRKYSLMAFKSSNSRWCSKISSIKIYRKTYNQ